MSDFTDFDSFYHEGDGIYRLSRDLLWDIGKKGSGWVLVIPEGEPFDITVPWSLRWAQSRHDRQLLPPSAIHDELLKRGFDKAFAAAEFRRAAIARRIASSRAWKLFFAVLAWTSRPAWMGGAPAVGPKDRSVQG